jgi:DNA-binding response OmpR family regulator
METQAAPVVLVAEDDPDVRQLVSFKLGRADFDVTAVGDGEAAWQAFESLVPDLVVLDVMMPGLSGIEVLRRIRRHESARVPVVLLSARSLSDDRDLGFAVGADDYLTKPFSPGELVHRVNRLLHRGQPRPR